MLGFFLLFSARLVRKWRVLVCSDGMLWCVQLWCIAVLVDVNSNAARWRNKSFAVKWDVKTSAALDWLLMQTNEKTSLFRLNLIFRCIRRLGQQFVWIENVRHQVDVGQIANECDLSGPKSMNLRLSLLSSTVLLIVCSVKQTFGYYCDHDFCAAEQYCCGENRCCDYISSPFWFSWLSLIVVIVVISLVWTLFRVYSTPTANRIIIHT